MRQRTHLHHTPTFEVDYKELGLRYKQKVTTVEAQFSGHKFSGKPRFKGHFRKYVQPYFLFLVHGFARNSGKSRFSGQSLGDRFFR